MDNLSKIKSLLKKDQRGLNIREISEKLTINRNSAAKLLDILTAKEEVEIRVHGRSKIYYAAKPQDYRKWFELLSRTVEELNNFSADGDMYAFIAGKLKHIAPEDTIIFINSFDQDTRTITVNAIEGLGPQQPDIEAILCRPLNGLGFSVPDRVLSEMLTGECNEIPGGLVELTFGGLPYETCKKIEAMPFFGKAYSAGISWNGRLNGAATFILPQGAELENHDLITFFIRQVAGFLSRREAEAALKKSEQFTREIIDNAKEGVVVFDRNFNYLVWNPFMESLTGISASETLGKNGLDLFPHLREQKVDILLQRALAGETVRSPDIPYHVPQTKKSGWVSGIYSPHYNGRGEIVGVIGNIRDITERKRAEQVLRDTESYLKSILHSSPVPQFVLDKNHHVVSWNRAIEDFSGVKEAEVLSTRDQWKAFYNAERPVLADLMIDEAVEKLPELYPGKFNKSPFVDGAYEVTDFFPKMGTHGVWLHFTAAPIRDDTGSVIGAVETLEDITVRLRAEEEVKQTRHNYETFFNTIDEFLFVLDEEGCILHTNETVIRRLGYTREELIGQPVLMLHPPDLRNESKRIMQELLAGTMDFCPLPVMTKDGHLIPVESRVTKGEWDGKAVLFGVCKDISEIRH
ncbi:MAG: PAS domain S-box protein [Methanoregula sp.]|nr:PAS domain S-box protein [Methanoregula sp.]